MTDAQILALLANAIEHDDIGTVALCDVALTGWVREVVADRIPEAAVRYEAMGGAWARRELAR